MMKNKKAKTKHEQKKALPKMNEKRDSATAKENQTPNKFGHHSTQSNKEETYEPRTYEGPQSDSI
jgi:hypothetical protein